MKKVKVFNAFEIPQDIKKIFLDRLPYGNFVAKMLWSHINEKPFSQWTGGKIHSKSEYDGYENTIVEEGDYPELDWCLKNGMKYLETIYIEW